jgi:hypothetical protein
VTDESFSPQENEYNLIAVFAQLIWQVTVLGLSIAYGDLASTHSLRQDDILWGSRLMFTF